MKNIRSDIKVFNNNTERDAWLKLNTLDQLNELLNYYKESSVPLPYVTWMMEGIKKELEIRKINQKNSDFSNQENSIESHLSQLSQSEKFIWSDTEDEGNLELELTAEEKQIEIYGYHEFMPVAY